jgi:hypothetical protein
VKRSSNKSRCATEVLLGNGFDSTTTGHRRTHGPDEEVFRFWIDEIREVGVHLLGRRLYETMLYWETADQDPSLDDAELEWAAL